MEGMNQFIQKISIERLWKETRKDKRILLLDLALLASTLLLVFTNQETLFFHLVYTLLIYGAFYWSLLAFVIRAGFWVTVVAILMVLQVIYEAVPLEELFELPILTFALIMVFGIARRRTNAEKALRQGERRYRRLVELAFESVIIVVEEKIVFVNSQAVKLLNADNRDQLIGESIGKILHPISFEGFKLLVKRAMRGEGEIPLIEEQFARLDNTYVDIEAVGLFITYQNQLALQLVIRNITKRKRAEEALRVSDTKFRGLLESAPDAIVVIDKNGIMTLVNAQTEAMFGYTRQEFVGSSVDKILPARYQEMRVLQREIYQTKPDLHKVSADVDISGVRKNGREFPISVRLKPWMDSEGLNIIAIIRDMTERKKAQEEIVQAARLAALGQMATTLAHELNNPLQIIQGYLDVILDFAVEPDEQEKYLHIIRQQIERLNKASYNILNYAKPQKEPQQPVALGDLINQMLTLTDKLLEQNQVRVELDIQDVPLVMIAPDPLAQVFLNLVINAIESTAGNEDGRLLHIKIGADDEQVFVSFTSNGPIIPPEDLPHIFEPFYSTKPEGSGLGLWVSRNLVERYNGRLEARNLPDGQGVAFIVSFPPMTVNRTG